MKIEHLFGFSGKIFSILRRFCGNIPFFGQNRVDFVPRPFYNSGVKYTTEVEFYEAAF